MSTKLTPEDVAIADVITTQEGVVAVEAVLDVAVEVAEAKDMTYQNISMASTPPISGSLSQTKSGI